MTGAPDYAAFKNGWWDLSENLQRMKEMIELKQTDGHQGCKGDHDGYGYPGDQIE
jgi:hypothetical protein